MKCPKCGHQKTAVLDTRPRAQNATVLRRRECPECGFRFVTTEARMLTRVDAEGLTERLVARVDAMRVGLAHDIKRVTRGN